MATDEAYEHYRYDRIEDGEFYQDFVVDVSWQHGLVIAQYASKHYQRAVGEGRTAVEIKHDKKYKATGNLCIECAEKSRPREGDYVPSGIMRDGHWLYAIGDYDTIYYFANNFLRQLRTAKDNGEFRYRRYEKPTSRGFLVPVTDGEKYAALVLRPSFGPLVKKLSGSPEEMARTLHEAVVRHHGQYKVFPPE